MCPTIEAAEPHGLQSTNTGLAEEKELATACVAKTQRNATVCSAAPVSARFQRIVYQIVAYIT